MNDRPSNLDALDAKALRVLGGKYNLLFKPTASKKEMIAALQRRRDTLKGGNTIISSPPKVEDSHIPNSPTHKTNVTIAENNRKGSLLNNDGTDRVVTATSDSLVFRTRNGRPQSSTILGHITAGMQRIHNDGILTSIVPSNRLNQAFYLQYAFGILQKNHLINAEGKPLPFGSIIAQIYSQEPGNLFMASLLQSGAMNRLIRDAMVADTDSAARKNITPLCPVEGFPSYYRRVLDSSIAIAAVRRDIVVLSILAFVFSRHIPEAFGKEGTLSASANGKTTLLYFESFPPYIRAILARMNHTSLDFLRRSSQAYILQRMRKNNLPQASKLPVSRGTWSNGTGSDSCMLGKDIQRSTEALRNHGLPGALSVLSVPSLLTSPFVNLTGTNAADRMPTIEDATYHLRNGMTIDKGMIPGIDTRIPVSRWPVDIYEHGDRSLVRNNHNVDSSRYENYEKFIRTVKLFANGITARWWSMFTTLMKVAVPGHEWILPTKGRWVHRETFENDLPTIMEVVEERRKEVNQYSNDTGKDKVRQVFETLLRTLLGELPLVQAIRGVAYRYAYVNIAVFNLDQTRLQTLEETEAARNRKLKKRQAMTALDRTVFDTEGDIWKYFINVNDEIEQRMINDPYEKEARHKVTIPSVRMETIDRNGEDEKDGPDLSNDDTMDDSFMDDGELSGEEEVIGGVGGDGRKE